MALKDYTHSTRWPTEDNNFNVYSYNNMYITMEAQSSTCGLLYRSTNSPSFWTPKVYTKPKRTRSHNQQSKYDQVAIHVKLLLLIAQLILSAQKCADPGFHIDFTGKSCVSEALKQQIYKILKGQVPSNRQYIMTNYI